MWFVMFALMSPSHAGLFGKKKTEEPAPEAPAEEAAADDEASEGAEEEAESSDDDATDGEEASEEASGDAEDEAEEEGDADEAAPAEGNPEVPPFDPTSGGGAPLPPMTWAPPEEGITFGTAVDVTLTTGGMSRTAHLDADWAMVEGDKGWSLDMTDVALAEGSDPSVIPEVWFVLAQPQLAEGDDEVRAYLPVDDLMSRLYRAMGTEPGALGQAAVGVKVAEAMKQGNVHAAASGQAELWAPLVLAGLRTSEVATALRLTGWLEGTGATEVIPVGEAACGGGQCVIVELRYTEGMGDQQEQVSTRYRIEPDGLKVYGAQRRTTVWQGEGANRMTLSILEKYLPAK